ncbi:MAG: HD domain-containing phosphohydrolase, partial [Bacillota bacterium]|nr:HD domain-containing phosphohydrolase [Bacillota bacterium]
GHRIARATPELASVADYILHHHERWDGTGYPAGLKGPEIPLPCRILAVVDAYDAMTNPRPYRPVPLSPREALDELHRSAGRQFDPELVRRFLVLMI